MLAIGGGGLITHSSTQSVRELPPPVKGKKPKAPGTIEMPDEEYLQPGESSGWVEMGGSGGIIALDPGGNISLTFNTPGMYRASMDASGEVFVGIYSDE